MTCFEKILIINLEWGWQWWAATCEVTVHVLWPMAAWECCGHTDFEVTQWMLFCLVPQLSVCGYLGPHFSILSSRSTLYTCKPSSVVLPGLSICSWNGMIELPFPLPLYRLTWLQETPGLKACLREVMLLKAEHMKKLSISMSASPQELPFCHWPFQLAWQVQCPHRSVVHPLESAYPPRLVF